MQRVLGTGALAILLLAPMAAAQEKLEPIRQVSIGRNAEFRVNEQPFFPIAVWLAAPKDFAAIGETNVNTLIGYPGGEGPGEVVAYGRQAWDTGFYFVSSYSSGRPADDQRALLGSPNLLGWIQDDEPDLPRTVSDANVVPASHMRVNKSTPFSNLVNGDISSWTVIEPVVGGEFTIRQEQPATVRSLAVWQTISPGLAVVKGVTFLADGKPFLTATLENRTGQQQFALEQPATFTELTVRVTSEYDIPGNQGYASLSEVQAFDAEGKNVLLSLPRKLPRLTAAEVLASYRATRAHGGGRPVFMTLTSAFMRGDTTWDEKRKATMYPALVKGADVLGFDIYPVYGYGYPGRLHEIADGAAELRALAGRRPTYQWIEANKGSQWISADKQPEVTPQYTRAEVWMAVIQGATGIGYFTHKWVDPDGTANYSAFAPTTEMRAEMRRLNAQLTRLAPALLAEPARARVAISMRDGLACHLKATQHDGAIYVFAQNLDLGKEAEKLEQFDPISPRAGTATITVPGLQAGTRVEVVDERRTVTAQAGRFVDEFGPLAEHIYRIPWRGK